MTTSPQFEPKRLLNYDFPKTRKKWAEILITELTDTVVFVLSPTAKPLYCSTSVQELLGWKDTEIIALQHIKHIIHREDVASFFELFQRSLRTRSELVSYTRLKSKPPPSTSLGPLTYPAHSCVAAVESDTHSFELKGYPHYPSPSSAEPECFFLMASPYPSRTNVMVDSFLDLKLENERLNRKVSEMRSRIGSSSTDSPDSSYRPSSLRIRTTTPSSTICPQYGAQPHSAPGITPRSSSSAYPDMYAQSPVDVGFPLPSPSSAGFDVKMDEQQSAAARRRKRRKMAAEEHHVCSACGRTDSPEWRKGPLGPKTLCNACGLRYAKTSKRKDGEESAV